MTEPTPPHVLRSVTPKIKGFDTDNAILRCIEYIQNTVANTTCKRPAGQGARETMCDCMTIFGEVGMERSARAVARYMVRWASFPQVTKRELFYEWKKFAKNHASLLLDIPMENRAGRSIHRTYVLPMCTEAANEDEDDDENDIAPLQEDVVKIMVCRNAITGLLDIGRRMIKASITNPGRDHGLVGRKGAQSNAGKRLQEVNLSLDAYFAQLATEGTPFATRIIREESGLTTRDDNPDDVALPPYMTMHKCYGMWCWERGWKLKKTSRAKTIYGNHVHREHDDDSEVPLWPTGSEVKDIASWPHFLTYWKTKFPNIKIRKKGADTCTDCLIMTNEFRMARRNRQVIDREPQDEDGEDDPDEVADELEREIAIAGPALIKAKNHVKRYQVQKKEAKRAITLARSDITNFVRHLPSLYRRHVLTIDMGQNLSLPNFEGEQPGDTFYLSPLTIYLFGVVDNATEDGIDRMNAYVWPEYEGDRGANNICSCLLKDFKHRGWLNRQNYGDLTIIADNCGGQNKNKHVVRFLMWLVEMGFFPQVRLFFLVKGHTKNACDRMFNLVKLGYHKRNTYTYNQLYDCINENEFINTFKVDKTEMFDFLGWQDKKYRAPGKNFNQSHIFTIKGWQRGAEPTTLLKQDDHDAEIRVHKLLPTSRNRLARVMDKPQRKEAISRMLQELKVLKAPGLRPIKQVELFTKWAPLLPAEDALVTCPKPPESVLKLVRDERRVKAATKRVTKRKRKDPKGDEQSTNTHSSSHNVQEIGASAAVPRPRPSSPNEILDHVANAQRIIAEAARNRNNEPAPPPANDTGANNNLN